MNMTCIKKVNNFTMEQVDRKKLEAYKFWEMCSSKSKSENICNQCKSQQEATSHLVFQ